MSCPYASNTFCSSLQEELRDALCAHCRIHTYPAGQHLPPNHWSKGMALMARGLSIKYENVGDEGKTVTSAIVGTGDLLNSYAPEESGADLPDTRSILCLQDCAVAFFEEEPIRRAVEQNDALRRAVSTGLLHTCAIEMSEMMREIGCKDAYAAVRYVLKFCKDHGVEPLTHEQIALACNRSRTTVTTVMHRIAQNEPELLN